MTKSLVITNLFIKALWYHWAGEEKAAQNHLSFAYSCLINVYSFSNLKN